jgi:hypothetical protein
MLPPQVLPLLPPRRQQGDGDGDKPTLSKSQLKKLAKGKGVSMH